MPHSSESLAELDFLGGALLLVDKPKGFTSFDVVNQIRYRLRRLTGNKKIKVGHSGTLDPMATGLLLIATGKSTKELTALTGLPKGYAGTITFGATTPSYDADSEAEAHFPTDHITSALLETAIREHLTGEIDQQPPAFSAIKVDGQRAYARARAGQAVELPTRRVTVERFVLTRYAIPEVDFAVDVTKGTYVRSLAHDLGKLVGSGAYLSALRRTRIGSYHLTDATPLAEINTELERAILAKAKQS